MKESNCEGTEQIRKRYDMELLQEIESYWTTRTDGYSEVNQKELAGMQKAAWLEVLTEHFPKKEKKDLRILDIGTGPGFFPTILSEAGYEIDAADYTPGMLEKARENVGKYVDRVRFWREDAQNLDFENETFDVIISRNLTWNLEEPARAYAEWMRVLKPGGKILNFDANWYGYLYDDNKRAAYEDDRKNVENAALDDHYTCTDIDRMEQIALQMPLSAIHRPVWDAKVLRSIGFVDIAIDQEIWKKVWSEEEKLNYGSTPMFMIEAVKPEIETKKRVTSYWSKRSDDFMKHKRAELHSVQAERWMNEIHRFLPTGKSLKILDIGCGAGFFSILLAKEGHQVTGVDLTPDMVERARFLALEEGISEDIAEGSCRFMVMDAENPEFADESFDVVISRNLTWTLPHADRAYEQWIRVLKKGGCLINADADYGADNFADTSSLPKSHVHNMVGNELMEECETIKQLMPISECRRPAWDVRALKYFDMEDVQADTELSNRLFKEKDEFYNPTPMFLVYGKKKR